MVKVLLIDDSPHSVQAYQMFFDHISSPKEPDPLEADEAILFGSTPSFADRFKPKSEIEERIDLIVVANLEDAKLRFATFQPDIVITDHKFPSAKYGSAEENGFNMIEHIRQSPWKNTIIAWNSASHMPSEALAKGADFAYRKPFGFEELNEVFQQAKNMLLQRS